MNTLREKIEAGIAKRQQLERNFWTACLDVYAVRPAWLDISGWSDAKLIEETEAMGDPNCDDISRAFNKHEQLNYGD